MGGAPGSSTSCPHTTHACTHTRALHTHTLASPERPRVLPEWVYDFHPVWDVCGAWAAVGVAQNPSALASRLHTRGGGPQSRGGVVSTALMKQSSLTERKRFYQNVSISQGEGECLSSVRGRPATRAPLLACLLACFIFFFIRCHFSGGIVLCAFVPTRFRKGTPAKYRLGPRCPVTTPERPSFAVPRWL